MVNQELIPRKHVYVVGLHGLNNLPDDVSARLSSDCYEPGGYSLMAFSNHPFVTTDGRHAVKTPRREYIGSAFITVPKMIEYAEKVGYRLGTILGRLKKR